MSQINIKPENDLWYITFPDLHYGKLEKNTCLSSGQVNIETYDNEFDWLDAMSEHGIGPDDQDIPDED